MRSTNLIPFDTRVFRPKTHPEEPTALSRLLPASRTGTRYVKAGTKLVFEGDEANAVMCVLGGWISLSKSLPDGQTQIIDFILPDDIISPAGADGLSSSIQIEALTDVQIVILSEAAWAEALRTTPELQRMATRLTAAWRARISERVLRLGKGSAPMRIAYSLLELGIRLKSVDQTGKHSFYLPLTQQKLGEFCGLTSVHVCRMLRRLVRHDVIAMQDHTHICIRDLDALADIAGAHVGQLKTQISFVAANDPDTLRPGAGKRRAMPRAAFLPRNRNGH